MTSPIRIALSGAQCSGKTTILEALKKDNYFRNFNFKESFSSKIAECTAHSEYTTLSTQLLMLYASLEQLQENLYMPTILDRCILDVIVYTKALNEDFLNVLFIEALKNHYKDIDIIFVLGSEGIEIDTSKSSRSTNSEYREKINKMFRNVDLPNVFQIPAGLSIEERVDIIRNKTIDFCKTGKLNKEFLNAKNICA